MGFGIISALISILWRLKPRKPKMCVWRWGSIASELRSRHKGDCALFPVPDALGIVAKSLQVKHLGRMIKSTVVMSSIVKLRPP